jgi:type I restriction enzyme S subunit
MTALLTDNLPLLAGAPNGIKKLRELILELAVRGKLVPQDPSDEPANELLERVHRVRNIPSQKRSVSTEASDGISLLNIPNGWAIGFIPHVVKDEKYAIKRGPFGSAIRKDHFVDSGFKVYEQKNAINDDFSLGRYYVSEAHFESLKAFEVRPGDIIISCSGTVGRVAVAPSWMERGLINQALLKVSLNNEILANEYFKILFPAFYMRTDTLLDLQGTAQKNMVSVDTLKKEPFPLPPLAEQHRIVAKVDELMALCDLLEAQQADAENAHAQLVQALLDSLTHTSDANDFATNWQRLAEHFHTLFTTESSIDSLKQTLLQLAARGKLVPQDPNDEPASKLLNQIVEEKSRLVAEGEIKRLKALAEIVDEELTFDLPRNWSWVRLGDLLNRLSNGYTGPQSKVPTNHLLTRIETISQAKINYERVGFCTDISNEDIQKYSLVTGDILLSHINSDLHLGKTALYKGEQPLIHGTNLLLLRPSSQVSPRFIELFLTMRRMSGFFLSIAQHAIGQASVNQAKVSAIIIALPPLAEQHRIVAKVDELMALCDQLKTRLTQARQLNELLASTLVEHAVA